MKNNIQEKREINNGAVGFFCLHNCLFYADKIYCRTRFLFLAEFFMVRVCDLGFLGNKVGDLYDFSFVAGNFRHFGMV